MTLLTYTIIAEALVLLALAIVLMIFSRRVDSNKRVLERFSALSIPINPQGSRVAWQQKLYKRIEDIFTRAGLHLGGRQWSLGMVVIALLIIIITLAYGLGAGIVSLSGTLLLIYAFLQFRYQQRAEALLKQLPRFIDNLERSLGSGNSLQAAFEKASNRAAEPLQSVLLRVRGNVELGGNLGEQLQSAANTMAVKEFQLLALTVNVHQRYGGSIKTMLHSITTMVKQREHAQREFASLTGETRFSAWVLGLLPVLIAGYMVGVNPGYLESLWSSESGRSMLYIAVGFQVTGGLVLWRMVKSI